MKRNGRMVVSIVAFPFMDAGSCDVVGLIPGDIVMALLMTIVPVACIAAATSELPMAVIAGCLLLGEVATPLTIFGVVVIIGSIALSELKGSSAGERVD